MSFARHWSIAKKKVFSPVVVMAIVALFFCIAEAEATTDNTYVSADSRINYYEQCKGTSDAEWNGSSYGIGDWSRDLLETYNIDVVSNGQSDHISDRGCRALTYAHAIQWLTGSRLETYNDQLALLAELVNVNPDPPNAETDYSYYLETTYEKVHGIDHGITKANINRDWDSVKQHFSNGGVIVIGGDGHISLAIGYTEKEIDGERIKLIQLVDSQIRSRAKRFSISYSWGFSSKYIGNDKKTLPNSNEHGQMWVTFEDFVAIRDWSRFTSTTAMKLSGKNPQSSSTFIAHERAIYSVNKAAIKESPASDSKTLRTASGEITIVAIYQNTEDKSVWYQLEDGGYVSMSDATFVRSLLDIKTSEVQAPMGELQAGNSFGLRGIIHTNCSIYKITGEILQDGQVIDSAVYFPKATELDINIRYTPINNDLEFGDLPAGDYIYRVSVQLGYLLDGGPCIGPSGGVIESAFTVVKPDPPSNPDIPDSPTATPSVSPTATPTATPTVSPTITPTSTPTVSPTITPTATPIVSPNITPTAAPTATTTVTPTVAPTTVSSPSPEPIAPPKTGDNTPLPIYLVMLVIATAGLLILNWHKSKA